MKFNMGCGHNKLAGWINVDAFAECAPDVVWNLEDTPWPWADNVAAEVLFIHSLEHMGADPGTFLRIIKELYRISAPGCVIEIRAPHPRHDFFLWDPTHVRPITPQMMQLFDREENDRWKQLGAANSPLAHYTGVDFKVSESVQVLSEPYRQQLQAGDLDVAAVTRLISERWNVVEEVRLKLVARKTGQRP